MSSAAGTFLKLFGDSLNRAPDNAEVWIGGWSTYSGAHDDSKVHVSDIRGAIETTAVFEELHAALRKIVFKRKAGPTPKMVPGSLIEEIETIALAALALSKAPPPMTSAEKSSHTPPERIRVAQDAEGFWTCREAVSGSQEYVRADLFDVADKSEQSTFEISARLLRERDEWQDLAILALPYLEDATSDPAYKQGAVRALIERIIQAHASAAFAKASRP